MTCVKSLKFVPIAIATALLSATWQASVSAYGLTGNLRESEVGYESEYEAAREVPIYEQINFTGSSSGAWTLPLQATPSTLLSNQDGGIQNRLEWGTTDCEGCTPFNNYVQYNGSAFSTATNSLFRVGRLSYRNGSTKDTFDGDFGLNVSLLFAGPVRQVQAFNFTFNILNTANLTGDPVLDADTLRFSNAGLTAQTFSFGGRDYTMQLVGFSKDSTGRDLVGGFNSPEGQTDFADLFARIIPVLPDDGGNNGEGETCRW
jgi:hypothetical protein